MITNVLGYTPWWDGTVLFLQPRPNQQYHTWVWYWQHSALGLVGSGLVLHESVNSVLLRKALYPAVSLFLLKTLPISNVAQKYIFLSHPRMWTKQPNIAFGYQWNSYEQMYTNDSYCNTQIVNLSCWEDGVWPSLIPIPLEGGLGTRLSLAIRLSLHCHTCYVTHCKLLFILMLITASYAMWLTSLPAPPSPAPRIPQAGEDEKGVSTEDSSTNSWRPT